MKNKLRKSIGNKAADCGYCGPKNKKDKQNVNRFFRRISKILLKGRYE